MSIEKFFVPEPTDMAKYIERTGPKMFAWYHRRDAARIGNGTSIEMAGYTETLVKDGKSDEEVMIALKEKYPEAFNL